MNETIRDYVKRRVRWALAIGIGAWLLIAATRVTRAENLWLTLCAFAVFFGAIVSIQWIKCPRCATRLGQVAMLIGAVWSSRKTINFCPYCGVDINEPREPRTALGTTARAVNPIK